MISFLQILLASSTSFTTTFSSTTPVDQTALVQRLIDRKAGKAVVLPAGTYLVRTITLPKDTRLTIGPKTILKGLPTEQSTPVLTLSTGVIVTGSGLIDGNRLHRKKGTGIQVFDAQHVSISGLHIREVAEQAVQIAGCKRVNLTNLQITGCGAKGIGQAQGINIVTSQQVNITKCRVDKAQHGIQWWGDDTAGWCENLRISGNQVRNVGGGGIWGNKGRNIAIINNKVETCGDVGIDFEHSSMCSASGNVVRNCKNYGLAIFYGSEQIAFTNNTVDQGVSYGHGIGLIGDQLSKQISFIGGSIVARGESACGLITVGTNIVQDVLIRGMRITTEGTGGIPIRIIDNNRFRIIDNPLITGISPTGVSLEGSSNSVVEGNVIVHQGIDASKFSDRGGIFVFFRSAEYPAQKNQIRRNTVRGYRTGINDDCWGNVYSENMYEQNITPNLVHRIANGTWGGTSVRNYTEAKTATPISVKQ
ncbi:right-handed parallel beta-helix repeat-containing protein [Fibrella forsythiae]|uniref:Right-handed parallel beta-helix repeat-containing protein n=1 Tax=Fibrella forsythiae TaxID=2817061 RepID=A0ABS3JH11_9BACT|nr:right-handed parallel beta-helix repeat-containing protein [Fibrella forsythiae]MBO0949265.1 right-handed parallel beta-helix repeat-containing protein [Fibrella forsythiae]